MQLSDHIQPRYLRVQRLLRAKMLIRFGIEIVEEKKDVSFIKVNFKASSLNVNIHFVSEKTFPTNTCRITCNVSSFPLPSVCFSVLEKYL